MRRRSRPEMESGRGGRRMQRPPDSPGDMRVRAAQPVTGRRFHPPRIACAGPAANKQGR